jgi:inorganic pyrophosphatase/exopolyphosphatase
LYKGAVFFGHMNPDADSVGMALGAAEFFGEGIAACPMRRDKCPNSETTFLMDKFNVGLDRLPLLSEIDDLANRSVVLVDFNDPTKGPASTSGTDIPELVSSSTGTWRSPPVLGVIDHHALQMDIKTKLPEFFYDRSGDRSVETHAWGCGTSVIALKFRESGREPSHQVAGMMLGAILSDTLGLTSPNTTPFDEAAVEFLAPVAGIPDVQALYQEQAEAKSSEVLSKDLFEVFDSDLKTYQTVPDAMLVIGSVEVYGESIYNGLFEKPDAEIKGAIAQVHQKYLEQAGADVKVHSYIWIVDVKNYVSTLLMLNDGDEACMALHALDKAAVPVLSEEKECRPEAPEVTLHGGFAAIATGSCVSRKSQLQPSLETSVRDYHSGTLSCNRVSSMEISV